MLWQVFNIDLLDNLALHQHNTAMLSAAALAGESASPSTSTPTASAEQLELEWAIFLAKERPDKLIPILSAFGFILACSFVLLHSLIVGFIGCIVAVGAVKEFLMPLRYALSAKGVVVRCGPSIWLDLPWQEIRSVYRTPAGLKLSPYRDPKTARLEPLRGVTLRFPRTMIKEVEERVAVLRRLTSEGAQA